MRLPLSLLRLLLAIPALASALAPSLSAQPAAPRDDRAAVEQAARDLLRAISTRDTVLARALLMPGAQLVATMDPVNPAVRPRAQGDSAFLRTIGTTTVPYLERLWEPVVIVTGTVALVHAPYDFWADGIFSHCGTDTFTLAKGPTGWRITHVAYTVQRAGCKPSPLGEPKR